MARLKSEVLTDMIRMVDQFEFAVLNQIYDRL